MDNTKTALDLPTCAIEVSGEQLWSRDQVLQIQRDAIAAKNVEPAAVGIDHLRFKIEDFGGLYDFLKARAAKPNGTYDRQLIGWAHAVRKLHDLAYVQSTQVSADAVRDYLVTALRRLTREYIFTRTMDGTSAEDCETMECVRVARAAMANATGEKLWCVHVQGPDDLIAQPSKEAAEKHAEELNAWFSRRVHHPYDPLIVATATVWPYSAGQHAAALLKQGAAA